MSSGIQFFNNTGSLRTGDKNGQFIEIARNTATKQGLPVQCLDHKDVMKKFPAIYVPPDREAVLEMQDAGETI